jgi:hypothetical protein
LARENEVELDLAVHVRACHSLDRQVFASAKPVIAEDDQRVPWVVIRVNRN